MALTSSCILVRGHRFPLKIDGEPEAESLLLCRENPSVLTAHSPPPCLMLVKSKAEAKTRARSKRAWKNAEMRPSPALSRP
jgi:hypothetical protein